ncbi:hypothetical protein HHI36_022909 [Cryptolaemus montrouzieri]|uniref:Protein naked cuticle homolog n=1 Tax=Cryptolaemus montrouzieri TaxID=559131 RepID=A0ABD2PET2_9CUCU
MDVWISFYNTHMANNLVKWWRTKFLNGYKQFSDCGDVKISDTEELLGRYDSEDENFDRIRRCQTPPSQERLESPVPQPENNREPSKTESSPRRINLEEFFCDVSVENTSPPGPEKQEFSFTLYDFDGHGKITKDDIAGLVTTIYEAIGSSVKVPHCGSKTIKVKLTVSPEERNNTSQKNTENGKNSNVRYKKDINVTIRQGTKEHRRYCKSNSKNRRKHRCCVREEETQQKHQCCKKEEDTEEHNIVSDDFSDVCSRLSSASSSEDDCENDHFSDQEQNRQRHRQKKFNLRDDSRYTIPTLFLKDIYNHQEKCNKNKKGRNRSSSLQRQELLEIIQANMEKNNLSFQNIGKQCTSPETPDIKSPVTESKHHHKHKATTRTESSSPLHHYFANMVEPTQFYVDLASLQNATQLPANYKYDKLLDAVIGVSNRKTPVMSQGKHRKHNRAKIECDNADHQVMDCPVNEEVAMSTPKLKKSNEHSNKKNSKKTYGVTGHTSSPHYLKHRNRQEDQARAMAQVVRWLEQEFSSNLTMNDRWEKAKHTGGFASEKESMNGPNTSKNVERHEHHHVHEHIHHHYHHYQETQFVV